MMGLYDALFASQYDRFLALAERDGLAARREELLKSVRGRVLEIGAGTGLNLDYYPDSLERLVLTEPSEPMARRLKDRVAASALDAEVVIAPAEKLPFEDDSFDTVVSTLVLCTVPDPEETLAEVRRVLAPGGSLLLMEHVRSESPDRAKWQDRLEKPWRWYGNGCRCNRDTVSTVESAGFRWDELQHGSVPHAPPIIRPLIAGRAVMMIQNES
ncbi:MAG: class I SAM-dependent methyltransferase [Thermoleophilaceae bacterium]|nr:class I SAM-dependent methyltransferase [Thermoleophilaceae bacterium]